jgi:hypothetical protein
VYSVRCRWFPSRRLRVKCRKPVSLSLVSWNK